MKRNWPNASQPLALLVIFLLSWGIASSLFPGLVNGNSTIMRIIFLIIGAQGCGILVSFVGLPGKRKDYEIPRCNSMWNAVATILPAGFSEFVEQTFSTFYFHQICLEWLASEVRLQSSSKCEALLRREIYSSTNSTRSIHPQFCIKTSVGETLRATRNSRRFYGEMHSKGFFRVVLWHKKLKRDELFEKGF